jgi:uncharacterized damage-inducible protein DinB
MTAETILDTKVHCLQYLLQNYAQYNLWANATLVYWLKSKSPELITTNVPSSFPSIRETLLHILNTQSYWASIFSEQPFHSYPQTTALDLVFEYLIDQSATMAEFIEKTQIGTLTDKTPIENPWFECSFQNFEYVMQCMNHSTYHRGQVVTMGRQLGITDAPNTDYNYYNVRGK